MFNVKKEGFLGELHLCSTGLLLIVIYDSQFHLFPQFLGVFWMFFSLHLDHVRFGTRLLEGTTRGSLQSRERGSAALLLHFQARKHLCDWKVWEVHTGLHPSRNLAHINFPPSFITEQEGVAVPLTQAGLFGWKALYNPCILDQTSTVAGA